MNIVFFVAGMNGGGAERTIASLANHYVKQGECVSIFVIGEGASFYSLDDRVNYIRLKLDEKDLVKNSTIKNMFLYAKCLKNQVPSDTDVVVAFDCRLAVVAKLALKKRVRVIGSERGNPYITKKGLQKRIPVMLSGLVDGFIFQTNGARAFYPKRTQDKSVVIPNGVFLNISQENTQDYCERDKAVCVTGNLRKMKRHDLIIEAFANAVKEFPDYKLHIYGEGEMESLIREQIASRHLQQSVYLHGKEKNVQKVLESSRIFLLASDYEGMPNGLIEAMACGCACIATDCNFGPGELIQNEKNGILIPVNDVDAMARGMTRLMSDEVYAKKLAQNARQINHTHALNEIAERYYAYFSDVLCK